eukprot:748900-Hanusia_phi.AAC.3
MKGEDCDGHAGLVLAGAGVFTISAKRAQEEKVRGRGGERQGGRMKVMYVTTSSRSKANTRKRYTQME